MVKKTRNVITYVMLGLILTMSFGTVAFAKTYDDWTTCGYEGVEDVSDTFERKTSTDTIRLLIKSSTGIMDFKAVGSVSTNPAWGEWTDCSEGRTERVYADTDDQERFLWNMINEWHYPYAGVYAIAASDSWVTAHGYFEAR